MKLIRDLKDHHKHQLNLINGEIKNIGKDCEVQIENSESLNESLK